MDVESNEQHDVYLERMKAEAEDRDSEDGEDRQDTLFCNGVVCVCAAVVRSVVMCSSGEECGDVQQW